MEALLDALLAWIGDNTDHDVSRIDPPAIVLMTPQELTLEYYTGGNAAHLVPEDGVDERLNALYAYTDGPNGTIYALAPEHVDHAGAFQEPTDNPLFREILQHELVHHVQWETGEADDWACAREGEYQAYLLGGRYLRKTRTPDPMPNRNFWMTIYGRC